jgi:hypothetical protein
MAGIVAENSKRGVEYHHRAVLSDGGRDWSGPLNMANLREPARIASRHRAQRCVMLQEDVSCCVVRNTL